MIIIICHTNVRGDNLIMIRTPSQSKGPLLRNVEVEILRQGNGRWRERYTNVFRPSIGPQSLPHRAKNNQWCPKSPEARLDQGTSFQK